MMHEDLLQMLDEQPRPRPSRRRRAADRINLSSARYADYAVFYEEFEDYEPRKQKRSYEAVEELTDPRDRKREMKWKRRREEN